MENAFGKTQALKKLGFVVINAKVGQLRATESVHLVWN
jgi:hypothetical protein